MARPDLAVFVNTGDGDCCSIGAAHWIHAIRYNMNLTVILHDNHVYGLTKKQASPTSPRGLKSNTTPRGSHARGDESADGHARRDQRLVRRAGGRLDSRAALRHHPAGLPPPRLLVRAHHPALPRVPAEDVRALAARPRPHAAAVASRTASRSRPSCRAPTGTRSSTIRSNIDRAREIASSEDPIPVGILYHNPDVPCYDDLRGVGPLRTAEQIRAGLETRARQGHRVAGGRSRRPRQRCAHAHCVRAPEGRQFGRPAALSSTDHEFEHSDRYGHGRPTSRATTVLLDGDAARRRRRRDRRPRPAARASRALPRPHAAALRLSAGAGRPRARARARCARCRRSSTRCCRRSRRAGSTASGCASTCCGSSAKSACCSRAAPRGTAHRAVGRGGAAARGAGRSVGRRRADAHRGEAAARRRGRRLRPGDARARARPRVAGRAAAQGARRSGRPSSGW